jgi:transposase
MANLSFTTKRPYVAKDGSRREHLYEVLPMRDPVTKQPRPRQVHVGIVIDGVRHFCKEYRAGLLGAKDGQWGRARPLRLAMGKEPERFRLVLAGPVDDATLAAALPCVGEEEELLEELAWRRHHAESVIKMRKAQREIAKAAKAKEADERARVREIVEAAREGRPARMLDGRDGTSDAEDGGTCTTEVDGCRQAGQCGTTEGAVPADGTVPFADGEAAISSAFMSDMPPQAGPDEAGTPESAPDSAGVLAASPEEIADGIVSDGSETGQRQVSVGTDASEAAPTPDVTTDAPSLPDSPQGRQDEVNGMGCQECHVSPEAVADAIVPDGTEAGQRQAKVGVDTLEAAPAPDVTTDAPSLPDSPQGRQDGVNGMGCQECHASLEAVADVPTPMKAGAEQARPVPSNHEDCQGPQSGRPMPARCEWPGPNLLSLSHDDALTQFIKDYIGKGDEVKELHIGDFPLMKSNTPMSTYDNLSKDESIGLIAVMHQVADNLGLSDILELNFPGCGRKIINIATHLASTGERFMYCEDFINTCNLEDKLGYSSPSISKMFNSDFQNRATQFYFDWYVFRQNVCGKGYNSNDATDLKSNASKVFEAKYGLTKTGEFTENVNCSILTNIHERLPVFMNIYCGNIPDVSTTPETVGKLTAFRINNTLMVVEDRGYVSEENIKIFINNGVIFLTMAKRGSQMFDSIADKFKYKIENPQNLLIRGNETLFGMPVETTLKDGTRLYGFAYKDIERAAELTTKFHIRLMNKYGEAVSDPEKYMNSKSHTEFLIFSRNKKTKNITVKFNNTKIKAYTAKLGIFILVTNDPELNVDTALDTYRSKDIGEKVFWRLKSLLDLGTSHMHSSLTLKCQMFIAFIALILSMAVHNTVSKNGLYNGKIRTLDKVFKELYEIKTRMVNGRTVLLTTTKQQKELIESFGIRTAPLSALP